MLDRKSCAKNVTTLVYMTTVKSSAICVRGSG